MEFDPYAVLARQNVEVLPPLKLDFNEIFTAVHQRLNIRPTINNPIILRELLLHTQCLRIFLLNFLER